MPRWGAWASAALPTQPGPADLSQREVHIDGLIPKAKEASSDPDKQRKARGSPDDQARGSGRQPVYVRVILCTHPGTRLFLFFVF